MNSFIQETSAGTGKAGVAASLSISTIASLALLLSGVVLKADVTVRFDLNTPEMGPFPTNALTVSDSSQKTGIRINLPLPDCKLQPSTCTERSLINQLDGFNLQARLTVRFSGPIDPNTLRNGLFFVWLDNLTQEEYGLQSVGHITRMNEVIYDPASNSAFAKPDEFLDQHRRYALVVTNAIRDTSGARIGTDPAFRACISARDGYCGQLREAIGGVASLFGTGNFLTESGIVAASVFTTMSATSWLEKARDQLQNSSINFSRPPKSVFQVSDLASMIWHAQTGVEPAAFTDTSLQLRFISNVGRLAFASYDSPNFLNEQQIIPATPTGIDVTLPSSSTEVHFTAFLPREAAPPSGYPVVIFGQANGHSRFQFQNSIADTLASQGFATLTITPPGYGFGKASMVTVNEKSGNSTVLPAPGRGVDLDGNRVIDSNEGCQVGIYLLRDCQLQTALDQVQLVRAIQAGMDLDGDGTVDLDPNRIYYAGLSQGSNAGVLLVAVEPAIRAASFTSGGGPQIDQRRWSPLTRPQLATLLGTRTPSLLNKGTDFDENYVLRNRPIKTNEVPGAIEIQNFIELVEWLSVRGSPIAYGPHLQSSTLPGVPIKPVLWQFGKGDMNVPNPEETNLIRSANMPAWTSYYRHDLARGVAPELNVNPHTFLIDQSSTNAAIIALASQNRVAAFFVSGGTMFLDVNHLVRAAFGRDLFEVPDVLTEDLNFPQP